MKAVVLVGGEGTRLRPLTYTTPKPLLPIVEVPLIERVVGHLAAAGVDEVVLSLGYRPDAFRDAFPNDTCAGVGLRYAVEPELLDTAGAIAFAASEAGIDDDRFLVVNGDVLMDADIGALIAFHAASGGRATVLLTPVEDPSAFGVVPTDDDGRVTAFIEKPARDEAPTNLINAGVYVLSSTVIDRIPRGRRVSIERETFPQLVADGELFAFASNAYWIDTGTPDKYLWANADLLAGRRTGPPAPGAVEVSPGRWQMGRPGAVSGEVGGASLTGAGTAVAAGACVWGSVAGRGTTVGRDARVDGSVLMARVTVGEGARVEGSIVGEDATIGAGAVVRNLSVVGGGAKVAPGAVLDNARWPDPAAAR